MWQILTTEKMNKNGIWNSQEGTLKEGPMSFPSYSCCWLKCGWYFSSLWNWSAWPWVAKHHTSPGLTSWIFAKEKLSALFKPPLWGNFWSLAVYPVINDTTVFWFWGSFVGGRVWWWWRCVFFVVIVWVSFVWPQGLMHARETLYHWAPSPAHSIFF